MVPLLFERQLHFTAEGAEDVEGIFGCVRLSPRPPPTSAVQFFFLLLGRHRALAIAGLLAAAGCERFAAERHRANSVAYTATDSMGVAARDISTVRLLATRELVEGSAAAMSRRQPGVLFTLNDSGNQPLLFAIDTTGADRGTWRVVNATNVDWESAAIGACMEKASAECRVHRRHGRQQRVAPVTCHLPNARAQRDERT